MTVSSSSLAEGIQQLASPGNDGSACLQSKTGHRVQMPAGGGREAGTACSPGLRPGQSGSMRSRGHLGAVWGLGRASGRPGHYSVKRRRMYSKDGDTSKRIISFKLKAVISFHSRPRKTIGPQNRKERPSQTLTYSRPVRM